MDAGLRVVRQARRVAKNRLFGVRGAAERTRPQVHDDTKRLCGQNADTLPVQMLISETGTLNHGEYIWGWETELGVTDLGVKSGWNSVPKCQADTKLGVHQPL